MAARNVWGDDHEIVSFCDIEPFAQKVLKKHWPDVPCHDDIKTMKGSDYAGIDILTGGFPCQPFSQAGQRRGSEDDRHLWPEMLRIIREAKPRWVVGENVRGLTNWDGGVVFDEVLSDLEAEGYSVQSFLLPACAVDAPHRRDRVWIIAYSTSEHSDADANECCRKMPNKRLWGKQFRRQGVSVINKSWNINKREILESAVCGINDGLSGGVDILKGLGNAIVPQVAEMIFRAIQNYEINK